MKILTIILLISFSLSISAQKSVFVRVYDLSGKKLQKGYVFKVTDSSLQFGKDLITDYEVKQIEAVEILMKNIGFIKTKRSAGHSILVCTIITGVLFTILGAVAGGGGRGVMNDGGFGSINFGSSGDLAAGGAAIGLTLGAGLGGISALLRNSETYYTNGDVSKWKDFQLKTKSKIK